MSAYNPPVPNPPTPIYNPAEFSQQESTGGISQSDADARYIKKAGDIATGLIQFGADLTTNEIEPYSGGTLDLGTSLSCTAINIGSASTNITLFGSTTYINVTDLQVDDPNILMNKNGLTPTGAGIQVESGGSVVSSLLNDSSADWVVNSTNNKLYLDEIQEKTSSHNIISKSTFTINKGLGPITVLTDRNIEATNGTVINELKTDVGATHGMVGTRTAHNLEIHTNNTPRITLNGTTGTMTLGTGSDIIVGGNDIEQIGSLQGSLNLPLIIGGVTGGSTDQTEFWTGGTRRAILTNAGNFTIDTTTDATSTTNGSLQTDGGLSVVKAGYFGGRITTDDSTNATTTADGSIQTDGGLSVVKDIILAGEIKSITDTSDSTSFTTGALQIQQGGACIKKSLVMGEGIALQTGLGAGPASIAYFDNNRTGGITVPRPTGVQPQCIEYAYSVDLTAGVAGTLFTITHSDTTNTERFIYLGIECCIFGCTTAETCLRVQNQNILLCCSNTTSGFNFSNGIRDVVVNNQTNSGALALGTTTFGLGTNTTTTTSITLSQSFTTGTPSTALYARGIVRMFSGNSTGVSSFITGITIG